MIQFMTRINIPIMIETDDRFYAKGLAYAPIVGEYNWWIMWFGFCWHEYFV